MLSRFSTCSYLLWLIALMLSLMVAQTSIAAPTRAVATQYPTYACDPSAVFCQSFSKNTDGMTLLASPTAAMPLARGQLHHDASRQTLVYQAGRSGGPVFSVAENALKQLGGADFYFEALLRPFANSTTDRETVYLTLKPANADFWYAVGLKAGASIYTSKVELVTLAPDKVAVLQERAMPIVLGAQHAQDGQWYLLRVERRQGGLHVFLNNELMFSQAATSVGTTFESAGVWSYNRSFELDYLRVGVAAGANAMVDLHGLNNQPLQGYVGDRLQFPWQSTDGEWINLTPELVKLESNAKTFSLTLLQPGNASVVLRSQSQPHVFKQLQLLIAPTLVFPSQTPLQIVQQLTPAPGSEVAADTLLSLTFDRPIVVNSKGAARIYQLQAGQPAQLVDEIKTGEEIDVFGSATLQKFRTVRRPMIWAQNNKLLIKPHSQRLKPGARYQVVLAKDLVTFQSGAPFAGVGFDADWAFSVRPAPTVQAVLRVSPDGSTDFQTVQGALDFVMSLNNPQAVKRIELAPGTYDELLYLTGVSQLSIVGAGAETSRIEFQNYDSLNSGLGVGVAPVAGHTAGGRSVFMIEEVGHLTLQGLSVVNRHQRQEGLRNQAETIYFNSKGKLIALDSHFISEQDTLMLKGMSYFRHCLIAGNVDFIWGMNYLSLFEQNEIRSIGNSVQDPTSVYAEGSYILQARTVSLDAPGFIFINNRFTQAKGPSGHAIRPGSTYIARSAGRPAYIDNVYLLDNQFDSHMAAQGWAGPLQQEPQANPEQPSSHRGWREFGSRNLQGQPLDLRQRKYGLVLTEDQLPYNNSTEVLQQHWPDFDWSLLSRE